MMVGYRLDRTTTANGYVARGVCSVGEDGCLTGVTERTHIVESSDGPLYTEDGDHYTRLPGDSPVSMNLWGFTGSFVEALRRGFPVFLEQALRDNPLKAEYLLPFIVNDALAQGKADVRVLPSDGQWYGVTYPEDRPTVVDAVARMTAEGFYPSPLWP
jgi:hypothetical protein